LASSGLRSDSDRLGGGAVARARNLLWPHSACMQPRPGRLLVRQTPSRPSTCTRSADGAAAEAVRVPTAADDAQPASPCSRTNLRFFYDNRASSGPPVMPYGVSMADRDGDYGSRATTVTSSFARTADLEIVLV